MNPLELLSSPVAYRVGWTLIHSLWEVAAVGAVAWVVLALLRRRSPQVRYVAASAAMAAILILTIATFLVIESPPEQLPPAVPVAVAPIMLPAPPTESATRPVVPHAAAPREPVMPPAAIVVPPVAPAEAWTVRLERAVEPYLPWLVAAWLAGGVALGLWRAGGWVAAYRLRVVGTQPASPAIQSMARRLIKQLGLARPVRIMQSFVVQTPMVIGWLRPVILLPAAAVAGLTPDQLEAILAHELAHIRRLDYLLNLVQAVIEVILFYHPAVWWIARRMRAERERCCDDVAVGVLGSPIRYVEALAAVEDVRQPVAGGQSSRMTSSGAAVAASGSGGRDLVDRVRRLLGLPDPACSSAAASATAILLLAGLLAISITLGVSCGGDTRSQPAAVKAAEDSDWGEAVDGVQAYLAAEKDQWQADEWPALGLMVRNTGTRAFTADIYENGIEVEVDGQWYFWNSSEKHVVLGSPNLPGGGDVTAPVGLGSWWTRKGGAALALAPGKHTVRAAVRPVPAEPARAAAVRVISNAVEIEVLPAAGKAAAVATASAPAVTSPGTSTAKAAEPPWGEAVEGVQLRLRPVKVQWKAEEKPELLSDLRNQGTRDLSVVLAPEYQELEFDESYVSTLATSGRVPAKAFGPGSLVEDIPLLLTRVAWVSKAPDSRKALALRPGKHRLREAFTVQPTKEGEKPVRVVSNPVEIEILAAPAEAPKAAEWGAAVEDLQVRLVADKVRWNADEKPRLVAAVRNAGPKSFDGVTHHETEWEVVIDGRSYNWIAPPHSGPATPPLAPNQERAGYIFWLNGLQWGLKEGAALALAPGRHTVCVAVHAAPTEPAGAAAVRVVSNAVEIEIPAAPAEAVKPVWKEAVEGIQVRLAATKAQWKADETPAVMASVRNAGAKPFTVDGTENKWELELDGHWYNWVAPLSGKPWSCQLAFNQEAGGLDFKLSGQDWGRPGGAALAPAPGKHAVRIAAGIRPAEAGAAAVRAVSNAVEIEILPGAGKAGAPPSSTPSPTVVKDVAKGVWVTLAPLSPIRSMKDYWHLAATDPPPAPPLYKPVAIPECTLEIRKAADQKRVAQVLLAGAFRDSGRPSAEDVRRIGNLPDGEYVVALVAAGKRCSNVARLVIDSKLDAAKLPALQLVPTPLVPGGGLLHVAVIGTGRTPVDPQFTNASILWPTLVVDGVERKFNNPGTQY